MTIDFFVVSLHSENKIINKSNMQTIKGIGIKKEEYRAITPYWAKRLMCMENGDSLTECYGVLNKNI